MSKLAMQDRARALRESFDAAFAGVPATEADAGKNHLCIGVGGDAFAIDLAEVTGLFADRTIVPVPAPYSEVLGVASLRGQIVPVYRLGAFLNMPPAEATPRWVLLAGTAVGFAFEQFDFHARVTAAEISTGRGGRGHIAAIATIAGRQRPIISIHSILELIARRTP